MSAEHWYALKVFYNRVKFIKDKLDAECLTTYLPLNAEGRPLIASLLFVKCSQNQVLRVKHENDNQLFVYTRRMRNMQTLTNATTGEVLTQQSEYYCNLPSPIDENEMKAFMIVADSVTDGLQYLGPDDPRYHEGTRVRVLKGPLKGAEGFIKRIKKDRKFIVCVSGVAAIATAHIDPENLMRLD